MSRRHHLRLIGNQLAAFVAGDRAAQLVEFAVTLPLLVVFVVGIFDFSGAFTLKQKLTNAARNAARSAAADPVNDLSATVPISVNDAFWTVDNYLKANKINDCGINPVTNIMVVPPTTWQYSISGSPLNGCPSQGLTIIINRGFYFPATAGRQPIGVNCASQAAGGQIAIIATCVSIQYGYPWKFGNVASLLGSTPVLPNTITATAVAMNEN